MAASAQARRIRGRLLILGLYALVTLVAPLLHHDFECHLETRPHCDVCTASPAASVVEAGVTLVVHAAPVPPSWPESDLARACAEPLASPGRAPPLAGSPV